MTLEFLNREIVKNKEKSDVLEVIKILETESVSSTEKEILHSLKKKDKKFKVVMKRIIYKD